MSAWFCRSRFSVAVRSGRPPAKLTIARRVHVMWSSQSLRMSSCSRWAFAVRAALAWSCPAAAWWSGAAGAPPAAARAITAAAAATAIAKRTRDGERRCIRSLLVGDAPFASGAASALRAAAEFADLPGDLRLDVERRLAAAAPPLVARDDERPDLRHDARVGRGLPQRPQLGLDVERHAALAPAHLVARLDELADLVVALARRGRAALRRLPRRAVRAVAEREPAPADLVVGAPGGRQRRDRDERCGGHHRDDDDAERLLHA